MSADTGKVSVIIVNYNTGDILCKCIESLYRYEDPAQFEVVIVDNSSPDDSREVIRKLSASYPGIKHLFLEKPVSFSAANNAGFELSSGDHILIMNPDIIFTEPVLSGLRTSLKENALSAVCPLLLGSDGKFQNRYFQRFPGLMQFSLFYSVLSKIFQNNRFLTNRYLYNTGICEASKGLHFTEQIPCAFLLTKRGAFIGAGKMDEDYKLFFEDVDLCRRLGKSGKIAVDASYRVTHLGGSSFRREDDFWMYGRFISGMLTFCRKHFGSLHYEALKFIARANSRVVVFFETHFAGNDTARDYRLRKHEYFLNETERDA